MPPGEEEINAIATAMAALENTGGNGIDPLTAVDPDFTAYDWLPENVAERVYPFGIRLPPSWQIFDRAMGSGSDKPFEWTVNVCILVGLSSNKQGPLVYEAARYVKPFYALYMANRSISGTCRNIRFGEGFMGDLELDNVKHWGAQFPIIIEQRRTFLSRL